MPGYILPTLLQPCWPSLCYSESPHVLSAQHLYWYYTDLSHTHSCQSDIVKMENRLDHSSVIKQNKTHGERERVNKTPWELLSCNYAHKALKLWQFLFILHFTSFSPSCIHVHPATLASSIPYFYPILCTSCSFALICSILHLLPILCSYSNFIMRSPWL